MSYQVYFLHSAEREVAEAQLWYEKQQAGLAAAFHSELGVTIDILSHNPLIYPVIYRNVRRAILHRFPYLVWYSVEESTVTVLACTHARINPANIQLRTS